MNPLYKFFLTTALSGVTVLSALAAPPSEDLQVPKKITNNRSSIDTKSFENFVDNNDELFSEVMGLVYALPELKTNQFMPYSSYVMIALYSGCDKDSKRFDLANLPSSPFRLAKLTNKTLDTNNVDHFIRISEVLSYIQSHKLTSKIKCGDKEELNQTDSPNSSNGFWPSSNEARGSR